MKSNNYWYNDDEIWGDYPYNYQLENLNLTEAFNILDNMSFDSKYLMYWKETYNFIDSLKEVK